MLSTRPGAGRGAHALSRLLAPVTPAEFFERYFEEEPLYLGRNDGAYFRDVYDVAEVENSLVAGAAEPEKFFVTRAEEDPVAIEALTIERFYPRARFSGRRPAHVLDPRAVLAQFAGGSSLVINDATAFSARLQSYVNKLQRQLGFYVQANAYLTPPNAQAFDVHHDAHGTLVMQIEGRKTWLIYDPVVELPLETQPLGPEPRPALTLNRRIDLAAGDTLYLPQGYPHEAVSGPARSLHVRLALCPIRAVDLLEEILDGPAPHDAGLRRALPREWYSDPGFAVRFAALVAGRAPRPIAPDEVGPASERLLRGVYAVTRAEAYGTFDALARFEHAAATTTVELRDDAPYLVRRNGATLELLVAGKSLGFPARYEPLIERLEREPMTLAEVDGELPAPVGRELVRALLLHGLIAVV
jgi:hypothetical protein